MRGVEFPVATSDYIASVPNPKDGHTFYNKDLQTLELYNGNTASWVNACNGGGVYLQSVEYSTNQWVALPSGTPYVVDPDNLPTNTQGIEVASLQIVPMQPDSVMRIEYRSYMVLTTNSTNGTVSIFRDSNTTPVASYVAQNPATIQIDVEPSMILAYDPTLSNANPIVYSIRIACDTQPPGQSTIVGSNQALSPIFGGTLPVIFVRITELTGIAAEHFS